MYSYLRVYCISMLFLAIGSLQLRLGREIPIYTSEVLELNTTTPYHHHWHRIAASRPRSVVLVVVISPGWAAGNSNFMVRFINLHTNGNFGVLEKYIQSQDLIKVIQKEEQKKI